MPPTEYNPPKSVLRDHDLKAPELLERGAATYRERNITYGDSYHKYGEVVAALLQGLSLDVSTVEAINRMGILTQIISKLIRYVENFNAGGHVDSIHDIMVYAAMLEELTREAKR